MFGVSWQHDQLSKAGDLRTTIKPRAPRLKVGLLTFAMRLDLYIVEGIVGRNVDPRTFLNADEKERSEHLAREASAIPLSAKPAVISVKPHMTDFAERFA